MSANYNHTAWFYDRVSRLVYGKALINAQVYLLQYIPQRAIVLIVGGGTGWILEELTKFHPKGLKITYVEIAADMMAQSKKRNAGQNDVVFINDAIENVILQNNFDAVITPFLFDNFTEQTLQRVFAHIQQSLKPQGIWLNADFQLTGKWWQTVLLKSMFAFFRLLCDIEASQLPDTNAMFNRCHYQTIAQKTFFNDFMISTVFTKGVD